MRLWLSRIWAWIVAWFSPRKKPLRTAWVEELPDRLQRQTIYVAGENGYLWFAAMLCPCGCRETVYMNLQPETRPCWRVVTHREGSVTIHPSIWRQVGCRSHFYVRHGLVQWC